MTKTELRELDADIAEHVMGWRCESCLDGFKRKWSVADWNRIRAMNPKWPKNEPDLKCDHAAHYTTDPAAAFEVLKKCAEKTSFPICFRKSPYGYKFWLPNGFAISLNAPTAELAACLFAKKLFTSDL